MTNATYMSEPFSRHAVHLAEMGVLEFEMERMNLIAEDGRPIDEDHYSKLEEEWIAKLLYLDPLDVGVLKAPSTNKYEKAYKATVNAILQIRKREL